MPLTHADIADIIRTVDQSTLDELVFEVGGLKIEIRRKGAAQSPSNASAPPASSAPAPPVGPATPVVPAAPVAPRSAPSSDPAAEHTSVSPVSGDPVLDAGQVAVRSPMVGTFYRRPSPGEPPYVEVGSEVDVDTPVGLIEVMKLYTTLYARTLGRIAWICPIDAELVEYDQILLIIDPA